jgi:hypothetical protein
MVHVNAANVNVTKLRKDNTLDNFVKIALLAQINVKSCNLVFNANNSCPDLIWRK